MGQAGYNGAGQSMMAGAMSPEGRAKQGQDPSTKLQSKPDSAALVATRAAMQARYLCQLDRHMLC